MSGVTWARQGQIGAAVTSIPSVQQDSVKNFRPPPTIGSDFRRLLAHDVPNVNYTFELVHDWYAATTVGYTPVYIRAQQTPIDWKSKIGNSDMSTNFKVTHDVPIYKGDIVVREDGVLFLLNWNVQVHPNNLASQSIECNAALCVTRETPDLTDANGHLTQPGGIMEVVPSIPCVHEEYAGRPDYMASQGLPGISADHLITVSVQWNSTTKNIRINDEFVIGAYTYRVVNVSVAEVNINETHGILRLNARRVAGGVVDD